LSRIIKSGQTVYQDLEVAVYGETFESAEEEDGPAAQEESYTLISEEKRHILEHARNQARESMAEILSDAYAQRDKIVNTAEKEAVRIREQAREQGHEQGLEEALSSVEDLTVRLRQEIGEAYERMENQLEDIRSQIVELSLDIAGKILEKRIEEDSGEMAELVKKAIQFERDKKKIDIHISAKALELAEALEKELEPLQEKYGGTIRVKKEECPPDRVRIETSDGILDASVFRQLEQLKCQLASLEGQI
jgi:flagellar assembly protein FliH